MLSNYFIAQVIKPSIGHSLLGPARGNRTPTTKTEETAQINIWCLVCNSRQHLCSVPKHSINDYIESDENTGSQSDKNLKWCVCRETLTCFCKYLETCFKRRAVTTSLGSLSVLCAKKQLC